MQRPGVYGQYCTDSGHLMALSMFSLARETWGDVCERLDRHVAAGQTGSFHETVFEEMTVDGNMTLAAVRFPAARWHEIDTHGMAMLAMGGKDNLHVPYAILEEVGVPVYVVADADALPRTSRHV